MQRGTPRCAHIVGAIMLSKPTDTKIAQSFYQSLFGETFSDTSYLNSTSGGYFHPYLAADSSFWCPRIALSGDRLEKLVTSGIHTVLCGSEKDESGVVIECTSEEIAIPINLVNEDFLAPAFADAIPPFLDPPRALGVVAWCDICSYIGEEAFVARMLMRELGWKMAQPVPMPGGGMYITMLDDTGLVTNGHRVGAVMPQEILLNGLKMSRRVNVPFFSVESEKQLIEKRDAVVGLGGHVGIPSIKSDGTACVLVDPIGCPFGMYHRCDVLDEVKPGLVLSSFF